MSKLQLGDVVDRAITLDPETSTFVFKALNARGEVVLQFPDQVILRDRAYDKQVRKGQTAAAALDLKA